MAHRGQRYMLVYILLASIISKVASGCPDGRECGKTYHFGGFLDPTCRGNNPAIDVQRPRYSSITNIITVSTAGSPLPDSLICYTLGPIRCTGFGGCRPRKVVCKAAVTSSTEDFIQLEITDQKLLKTNFHKKVSNEEFSLLCTVASVDAQIRWVRLFGEDMEEIVSNNERLSISSVTYDQQGSYVCIASQGTETVRSSPQVLILADYVKFTVRLPQNDTLKSTFHRLINDSGFQTIERGGGATPILDVYKQFEKQSGVPSSFVDDIRNAFNDTYKLDPSNSVDIISYCSGAIIETEYGQLDFPADTFVAETAASQERSWTSDTAPRATCRCNGDLISAAEWDEPVITEVQKNDSDIFANFEKNIENTTVTADIAGYVAETLEQLTASENITTDYFGTVALTLDKISEAHSSSNLVTESVIDVINNIVDVSEMEAAADDNDTLLFGTETSAIILHSFEQQLANVRDSIALNETVNFTYIRPNVAVQVVTVTVQETVTFNAVFNHSNHKNKSEVRIAYTIITDTPVDAEHTASIVIPGPVLETAKNKDREGNQFRNGTNQSSPVSFVVHRSGVLFPANTTAEGGPSLVENTAILSADVGSNISNLPDDQNIIIHFYPLKWRRCAKKTTCRFWDDKNSKWSSEGCQLVKKSSDEYICKCNHLTNFAVLVDPRGDIESVALDTLSKVGCVLSIVGLLLTIVTFLSNKKLRDSLPKRIILNLACALLGLYISFMLGIDRVETETVCLSFGFLIHFFCLAALAWMGAEVTYMYFKVNIKYHNSPFRGFVLKASVVGWGFPIVVVGICVGLSQPSYLNCQYCFPDFDSLVFKIAVLGLISLMLLYNIILFTLVAWSLLSRKVVNPGNEHKEKVRQLQTVVMLSLIIGLTWVFGFLAIGKARIVFNILFILSNAFQGVIIFLLFCYRDREVRKVWEARLLISFRRVTGVWSSATVIAGTSYGKTGVYNENTSQGCIKSEMSEMKCSTEALSSYSEIGKDVGCYETQLRKETSLDDDNDAMKGYQRRGTNDAAKRSQLAIIEELKSAIPCDVVCTGSARRRFESFQRDVNAVIGPLPKFAGSDGVGNVRQERSALGKDNKESNYSFVDFKPTVLMQDAPVRITSMYPKQDCQLTHQNSRKVVLGVHTK